MITTRINQEITSSILKKFEKLTLSFQPNKGGKFFADKSYAFDTIFFCSRFISRFRFGNLYYHLENKTKASKYIQDLFCLQPNASQIQNYMTETIALLCFSKVLQPCSTKNGVYEIIDDDLLDFISTSFENSYIFQYLLAYCVFHNDNLWNFYEKFCKGSSTLDKQLIYNEYQPFYARIDCRVKDLTKGHAMFTPKFPMVVMNFVNQQNMCSRTGKVQDEIVTINDISLNQEGTRAGNNSIPKKNSYLRDFSISYVVESLRPYLTKEYTVYEEIVYSDSYSIDVADVKLDMLDIEGSTMERKRKMQSGKYKKTSTGQIVRTVQSEFRNGLLKIIPHSCPICGFKYESFLIASHIKPYAKCDDTYDAMNPNNGLLMCPICDKLFESANFMTIDYKDGKVIYDLNIEKEDDFRYLQNKSLPINFIDCERKHYLKWHNEEFYKKHHLTTSVAASPQTSYGTKEECR